MTMLETKQAESDIASGVRRIVVDKMLKSYPPGTLEKAIEKAIHRETLAELKDEEPPQVTEHRAYWVGYEHGKLGHDQRPDGYAGQCRTDYLMGWTNGRLHYVAGRADLSEHDANGEA